MLMVRVHPGEPIFQLMESNTFYVYVLQNPNGQLYIGYTTDLEKRTHRHQNGKAGWTRNRGPWELVHYETFSNRAEAMRFERHIKSGRTNQKLRNHLMKNNGRAGPSDDRKD
jgi:putative endonuclease